MEKEDDKQTNKEFWGVLFDHIPEKSLIRPRSSDSHVFQLISLIFFLLSWYMHASKDYFPHW